METRQASPPCTPRRPWAPLPLCVPVTSCRTGGGGPSLSVCLRDGFPTVRQSSLLCRFGSARCPHTATTRTRTPSDRGGAGLPGTESRLLPLARTRDGGTCHSPHGATPAGRDTSGVASTSISHLPDARVLYDPITITRKLASLPEDLLLQTLTELSVHGTSLRTPHTSPGPPNAISRPRTSTVLDSKSGFVNVSPSSPPPPTTRASIRFPQTRGAGAPAGAWGRGRDGTGLTNERAPL
uniref:Uncharacterized protein n=1 Tax=Pipistrellus kuhlii TaxID=59472 RepID=A0A7J7SFA2_PIPKU|nr:hypothetical protein mPipKuh1_009974 [Pipistrellus kuhlii]